jgi:preprotein translocase subunit SecG
VRVVLVVLVLVVLVRRRFGVGMGESLGRFLAVGRRLARSQKAILVVVLPVVVGGFACLAVVHGVVLLTPELDMNAQFASTRARG